MADGKIECPSCGGMVDADAIVCPSCGLNLRTGEAFDEQMKRGRQRRFYRERYSTRIVIGVAIALGVLLFGGYMYQTRLEKAIRKEPDAIRKHVLELHRIDGFLESGNYGQAAERAKQLIAVLEREQKAIRIEVAYGTDRRDREAQARRPHLKAKKALLVNLTRKARHKLKVASQAAEAYGEGGDST